MAVQDLLGQIRGPIIVMIGSLVRDHGVAFRKRVEAAREFEPPGWIDQEVTGDERYLNETLATRGRPS